MNSAQVAVSLDFLKAFAKVPKAQQKKVREFTEKFRANPMAPGINFEKINKARDPNVRSVRIDKTYRAIVVKPPKGDVFLCAWVDHHDKAYDWAQNRIFEVNPTLGHLQVFEVSEDVQKVIETPKPVASPSRNTLFSKISDDTLQAFGVPSILVPAVKNVENEAQLSELSRHLPADVNDALYLLSSGMSPEEVLEEVAGSRPVPSQPVDTEDFSKALEQPESLRQFAVVDQHKLSEILTAPLEQWRLFLHPDQRKLIEWEVNGPIRVLGGAGTGKTVALMHRAAYLQSKLQTGERMLVTTYTKNLALEISSQLKSLCADDLEGIDVVNLDGWAYRYMSSQGSKMNVGSRKQFQEAWSFALEDEELNLTERFYKEEWDRVVLSQDVVDQRSYFKASRRGRGTRLTRTQRAAIWKIFAKYRSHLDELGVCHFQDIIREARLKLEAQGGEPYYRYVLADEVQDFSDSSLRLLKALAPSEATNNLFLVGDPHQRIYGKKQNLGQCGIAIVGRSRRLKVNYRTTEEIGRWATNLLTGQVFDDMDGGTDDLKGYHALRSGQEPTIETFEGKAEEEDFILKTVKKWLAEPNVAPAHICLTTRDNDSLTDVYQPLLENAGIDTVQLDSKNPEASFPQGAVRLATMHRMKGMEFPRVLMASCDVIPKSADQFGDQASFEDYHQQELSLKYVAATRARDLLTVCQFGEVERKPEHYR